MNHARIASLAAFAGVGLLLYIAPPASAQGYSLTYYGLANVTTSGNSQQLIDAPTGLLTTYTSPVLQVNYSDTYGSGTATSYGTSSIGSLHTYAASSASATTAYLAGSNAKAMTSAGFVDTGMVTSATLPVGTSVQLQITLNIHDMVSASTTVGSNGVPLGFASLSSTFSFTPSNGIGDFRHFGNLTYTNDTASGASNSALQATVTAEVGEAFTVDGYLEINALSAGESYGLPAPRSSFAIADASNTANFNINALTSGVSLTTASGHDYATPAAIPEASTALSSGLLLMLGLGGFAAARKRKAEKQSV